MIEEHVIKLAELQAERTLEENKANGASALIDMSIKNTENELKALREERETLRLPYIEAAEELSTTIGDLCAAIIDEWTGENKTMVFDAGTLKFRTTQRLNIVNKTLVLTGLLDHASVKDVATNYITGFNKTAVKKYMGVLELPLGAAEFENRTTVKLE